MRINKAFLEKNKEYINFYGGIIIIASIMFFGPKFLKWYGGYYEKKVDKNGVIVKGEIIRFGHSKGKYIEVRYYYKSKEYTMKENIKNFDLFIGQDVSLMVDTTDPYESYVIENFSNDED